MLNYCKTVVNNNFKLRIKTYRKIRHNKSIDIKTEYMIKYEYMQRIKKTRQTRTSRALEKATKTAKIQLLREQGATYRDIASMLKIGQQTVADCLKYSDQTVEKLKSFIKRKQLVEDYKVADKARIIIENKLETGKTNFRDTVGAWKIARELQQEKSFTTDKTNLMQGLQIIINK
jgi:hypothetical protein